MPRFLILCVGSRGDVEPFAALAASLHTASHPPPLAYAPKDYVHLLPPSADTRALPFDTADIIRCFSAPPPPDTPPHLVTWAGLGRAVDELVLPHAPDVLAASREGDGVAAVVTSYLMRPLALIVADALGVPVVVVQLQPQVPTAFFPHHSRPEETAAAILAPAAATENMESFVVLELLLYNIFCTKMNALRKDLSLPTLSFDDMFDLSLGRTPTVHVANAFPQALVKDVTDTGPHVHHVGPLADSYFQKSAGADDLAVMETAREFLAAGETPVCVGLGSMNVSADVCRMIMAAVKEAGVARAVLVGGASGLGAALVKSLKEGDDWEELRQWVEANTLSLDSISYPWLLPQCSLMVCHGGAGVISSTLRAGIPAVVMPQMFDQFMWARLVEGRGLGAAAGPVLEQVTQNTLVDGIRRASSPGIRSACASMGKHLQAQKSGVENLISLLVKIGK